MTRRAPSTWASIALALVLALLPSLAAAAILSDSQYVAGDTITLSGTTYLAAGDRLQITVTSASFRPSEKTQDPGFSGASGTVTVVTGTPLNTWSFTFDTSGFRPDEYLVRAESVEVGVTETGTFRLLEKLPGSGPGTLPVPPETPTPGQANLTAPAGSPAPTSSPRAGISPGFLVLPPLLAFLLRSRR